MFAGTDSALQSKKADNSAVPELTPINISPLINLVL